MAVVRALINNGELDLEEGRICKTFTETAIEWSDLNESPVIAFLEENGIARPPRGNKYFIIKEEE